MRRRPLTSRDPRTEAWLRKNAVACLALAILACGDGSTNPADGPALRILAGANLTDTIGAAPLQGLVVQVLDSDGRPEPGVEVQFESAPDVTPAPPLVYVGAVGDRWMLRTVSDTTDGKGRATVRVRLGDQVGPASIVIRVPLHDLVDTAAYTVLPGAPVRAWLTPKDTAVTPGASFTYLSTLDRANNRRSDPATYEVAGTAVDVDQTGRLTAREPGTAVVRVRATIRGSVYTDSAWVGVVPPEARIAWIPLNGGLVVSGLDGANETTLLGGGVHAPVWAPSGDRLVYQRSGSRGGISMVQMDGSITDVTTPDLIAGRPEFSRDGQWIYFHAWEDDDSRRRIFRVRPDGSGLEELGLGLYPTPSPDGRSVAWTTTSGELVIHDLAAGTERVLPGITNADAPRWSPDGAWIAYTTRLGGDLMLVRPDGTESRRIDRESLIYGISWSPDSRWIIGNSWRFMIVDVSTGLMAALPLRGGGPAWRP